MLKIIFGIVLVLVIIGLLARLFKFFLAIVGLTLIPIFGLQTLIGYCLVHFSCFLKFRERIAIFLCVGIFCLGFSWGALGMHPMHDSFSFSSLKFILSGILAASLIFQSSNFNLIEKQSAPLEILIKKKDLYFLVYFTSIFITLTSGYIHIITDYFLWSKTVAWYTGLFYWISSLLLQLYCMSIAMDIKTIHDRFKEQLNQFSFIKFDNLTNVIGQNINALNLAEISLVVEGMLVHLLQKNVIKETELNDSLWIFPFEMYLENENILKNYTYHHLRSSQEDLVEQVIQKYPFGKTEAIEFIEKYLDFGTYYNFRDGRFFCSFNNNEQLKTCLSCGTTEQESKEVTGPWYCSDLCKETEQICENIHEQPYKEFLSSAATSGLIVMAGAHAWSENQKVFATGGQGHGFAAENANDRIDRIKGKDAKILGGDNAKDGADRSVNGKLYQDKYCATGQRSVNAAFNGDGNYRYVNPDGTPMQLEVPKDQYDNAVESFAKKIEEGKVPGVTDPDKAKDIIRKGHITYQQSVNITKFGTIESLAYDFQEGIVTGLSSAGISFCITAVIHFANTHDKKKTLQTAGLQAGQSFAKTMAVYVSTQQLHRLEAVQKTLKSVDISNLPKSIRNVLSDGLGETSKNGINKALRGTIVTSAALVAVSTGPDLVKLARGRISSAQVFKNITTTSSSIAGGTIGSIAVVAAMTACATPFGPAALVAGRVAGGIVGGSLTSLIANKITGELIEDDSQKMLEIIKVQIEYLTLLFMLTTEEQENLTRNLQSVLSQEMLEKMFAEQENRNAFANLCLKPLFVGIVKQREPLKYNDNDIAEALSPLAA